MKFGLIASSAVLLTGSSFAADVSEKKCNALTMSGGGSKGAYEAGGLYGMYEGLTDKSELEYDVVTGVSAGSINTIAVSVFAKGDEKNMVDELSRRWQTIKQNNLFVQWFPFGPITGLFRKTGLFNTAPLEQYFKDFLKEYNYDFKKKLVVSSVDVNTGAYVTFTEKDPVDITKAALASASIPFVFPNIHLDGHILMDGGSVWNLNIISAIDRCRETVDDDSQITIDIVTCEKEGTPLSDWEDKSNAYNNFLRNKEIKDADDSMLDIYDVMHAFPKVNYRYYVAPSEATKGGVNLIKTDNATVTWPFQQLGRSDGENEVKTKSGFNKLIDYVETNILKKEKAQGEKADGTVDLEFVQK